MLSHRSPAFVVLLLHPIKPVLVRQRRLTHLLLKPLLFDLVLEASLQSDPNTARVSSPQTQKQSKGLRTLKQAAGLRIKDPGARQLESPRSCNRLV